MLNPVSGVKPHLSCTGHTLPSPTTVSTARLKRCRGGCRPGVRAGLQRVSWCQLPQMPPTKACKKKRQERRRHSGRPWFKEDSHSTSLPPLLSVLAVRYERQNFWGTGRGQHVWVCFRGSQGLRSVMFNSVAHNHSDGVESRALNNSA